MYDLYDDDQYDSIQYADVEYLRQTIIRIINLDAQTRIGMFNHQHQTDIVKAIPGLLLRDDSAILLGVVSRYILFNFSSLLYPQPLGL